MQDWSFLSRLNIFLAVGNSWFGRPAVFVKAVHIGLVMILLFFFFFVVFFFFFFFFFFFLLLAIGYTLYQKLRRHRGDIA